MKHIAQKAIVLSSTFLWTVGAVWAEIPVSGANVVRQIRRTSVQAARAGTQRTFQQGLRIGGRYYIVSSLEMGQEMMLPLGSSAVGNSAQQKYLNTLRRTQILGSTLSHQIAQRVSSVSGLAPFPGFEISFPEKWEAFSHATGVREGTLAVVLDAAFGSPCLAEGVFVPSFEHVRRLSVMPVDHPVSVEQAMEDAFEQAEVVRNGFFVIRIVGNERRPKDTLILDISTPTEERPFRWISVNHTRDKAQKAVLRGELAAPQEQTQEVLHN